MSEQKIPSIEGLRKARRKIKDILEKQPSDNLISIIDEVTKQNEVADKNSNKKPDVAALPAPDIDPDLGA